MDLSKITYFKGSGAYISSDKKFLRGEKLGVQDTIRMMTYDPPKLTF